MRSFSSDALLLNVTDLQEQDRIVTFLTPTLGKRRGVAPGARRKYSRFAGQLQPLATVHLRWFEKEGRDLVRIGEVELVRPAQRLQEDLEGILLAAYLAEHADVFAQDGEPADLYYRLLDSTVAALLDGVDRDLAARYYEVWTLRLAGIFPAPRECPLCGRAFGNAEAVLRAEEDGLICGACAAMGAAESGGDARLDLRIGAEVLDFLRRSGREPLPSLAAAPPPAALLRRVEEVTAVVRRRFLERELKSYGVMKSITADLRET